MPRFADASKPTSVYLIQVGPLVKIGLSVDVRRRVTSLSSGMTEAPTAVLYREFRFNEQAFAVERFMHRHFHKHRVRGEWFKIDIDEAITLLDELPVPPWDDVRHGAWKEPSKEEVEIRIAEAMRRGQEAASKQAEGD